MRLASFFVWLATVPVVMAEPTAYRDLAYAEPKNERQTLDVFAPAGDGKGRTIIFWIHGGSWIHGDKSSVLKKPKFFTDKGYVFAATNYRFHPNVTLKEMAGDIAKAIRYVRDHAVDYGGNPDAIVVMGHSAGAHLAALVCTDERYLTAEKVPMTALKGCVPVDVSAYDIPKRIKDVGSAAAVFGTTEQARQDASPVAHVAAGKGIPPFLILYVADREEAKVQSIWFAEKLKEAGVAADLVPAEGKTHATINSGLGVPEDKPTREMWAFLERLNVKR